MRSPATGSLDSERVTNAFSHHAESCGFQGLTHYTVDSFYSGDKQHTIDSFFPAGQKKPGLGRSDRVKHPLGALLTCIPAQWPKGRGLRPPGSHSSICTVAVLPWPLLLNTHSLTSLALASPLDLPNSPVFSSFSLTSGAYRAGM